MRYRAGSDHPPFRKPQVEPLSDRTAAMLTVVVITIGLFSFLGLAVFLLYVLR